LPTIFKKNRYARPVLKLLSVPAGNERTPRFMEKALGAIHQSLTSDQSFSLEYGVFRGHVALFCRCPDELQESVTGPLLANYPRSTLETVAETDDPALFSREGTRCWTADIELQPELYPILRHAQFEDLLNRSYADPIDSLLRALLPTEDGQCLVEFRASPVTEHRRRHAEHDSARPVHLNRPRRQGRTLHGISHETYRNERLGTHRCVFRPLAASRIY
jgi:hypothetical protein